MYILKSSVQESFAQQSIAKGFVLVLYDAALSGVAWLAGALKKPRDPMCLFFPHKIIRGRNHRSRCLRRVPKILTSAAAVRSSTTTSLRSLHPLFKSLLLVK